MVEVVRWSAMKSSKGTWKQRYCSSGKVLVYSAAAFVFLCPGRRGFFWISCKRKITVQSARMFQRKADLLLDKRATSQSEAKKGMGQNALRGNL